MKKTYKLEVKEKMALNRRKYCRCGSHIFNIIHQLEPIEIFDWWIECPECGRQSIHSTTRKGALWAWTHDCYDGDFSNI